MIAYMNFLYRDCRRWLTEVILAVVSGRSGLRLVRTKMQHKHLLAQAVA